MVAIREIIEENINTIEVDRIFNNPILTYFDYKNQRQFIFDFTELILS